MGRTVPQPTTAQPAGFYQEINASMMEDMWRTLAVQVHPRHVLDRRDGPPTLDEIFSLLADATWDDFWNIFPYELRENSSFPDELDALALLLASPASKQRFQRYFEEYASFIVPAAGGSSAAAAAAAGTAQRPRHRRLGLPLMRTTAAPGSAGQQQQQQELPTRRRALQDGGGPIMAYVSPAAPGRLLAAAAAAAAGAEAQQHGTGHNLIMGTMLSAFGLGGAWQATQLRTAGGGLAAMAATGVPAGLPVAGTPAAAAGQRMTGRRRSWLEACDTDGPQPGILRNAAAAAGTPGQALPRSPAAAAMAAPGDGAGTSAAAAAAVLDRSRVWRAVHEALTADDEAMLVVVSQLVPYSFEGQLHSEADTRKQLQALADSRPVPQHVVQAIADRLAAPSDTQLVRLTARSGYSKRAAAAAAALACTSRKPFYISLAGCHTEEEVENAILRGIFCDKQEQPSQQQQPGSQEQQQLAVGSQQQGQQRRRQAAEQEPQHQPIQEQQQTAQGAERPNGAGEAATGTDVAAAAAPPPAAAAVVAPAAAGDADAGTAAPTAAAAAAARAAGSAAATAEQDDQQQQEHETPAGMQLRLFRGIADFVEHMHMEEEESMSEALDYYGTQDEGGASEELLSSDREMSDDCTDRCAEQLSAHLALLGACSKQPLLLLLDEADAAMVPEAGVKFKLLLLRMLCQLPQVMILVTDSFEPDSYMDSSGGSVLRPQGKPAVYALPDGKLSIGSYRLPHPLYYHCLHCF